MYRNDVLTKYKIGDIVLTNKSTKGKILKNIILTNKDNQVNIKYYLQNEDSIFTCFEDDIIKKLSNEDK